MGINDYMMNAEPALCPRIGEITRFIWNEFNYLTIDAYFQ
jgi:hypothetical protein